jgi:hypothetical protein
MGRSAKFTATDGIDGGFESGNAAETPFGIDEGLDEDFFVIRGRAVKSNQRLRKFFVGGNVVGGEQDGLPSESGFRRVVG